MFVVVGKCCVVCLQHAFTDALAAAHHGCVCNSWHYHVLWGRALGHCTSKTGCYGSKVGNPVELLGELMNLLMICFDIHVKLRSFVLCYHVVRVLYQLCIFSWMHITYCVDRCLLFNNTLLYNVAIIAVLLVLQCFDTVWWASGKASSLKKIMLQK